MRCCFIKDSDDISKNRTNGKYRSLAEEPNENVVVSVNESRSNGKEAAAIGFCGALRIPVSSIWSPAVTVYDNVLLFDSAANQVSGTIVGGLVELHFRQTVVDKAS